MKQRIKAGNRSREDLAAFQSILLGFGIHAPLRRLVLVSSLPLLSLVISKAAIADACPSTTGKGQLTTKDALTFVVPIPSAVSYIAVPNPLSGPKPKTLAQCFLTSLADVSAAAVPGATCPVPVAADPFVIAACTQDASTKKTTFIQTPTPDDLIKAQTWYIGYRSPTPSPSSISFAAAARFLLLKIDKHTTETYQIVALFADASVVNVDLFAGGSYLFSQSDFSKFFPQVELHFSLNPIDRPGSFTLRLLAEGGLTSTTASSAQPSADVTVSSTKTAFGSIAPAAGWNVQFSAGQLSVLAIARFGGYALPADSVPANPTASPNSPKTPPDLLPLNTVFGVRFQWKTAPPASAWDGMYLEAGLGQSNQYAFQKSGRIKVDFFAPFTGGTNGALALRIQVDSHNLKNELVPVPTDTSSTANTSYVLAPLTSGDVKISLLWAVGFDKLAKILGGVVSPGGP